jgi:hypothetical protein
LQVTLADDDDTNFALVVWSGDRNQLGRGPVNVPFSLPYAVTVQAVADTPIVDVGALKQDVWKSSSTLRPTQ